MNEPTLIELAQTGTLAGNIAALWLIGVVVFTVGVVGFWAWVCYRWLRE